MKQSGVSGDYLEWKRQREEFEYAQKLNLNPDLSPKWVSNLIEEPSRLQRIRSWMFSPRGALVYFGIGYAATGAWLFFR